MLQLTALENSSRGTNCGNERRFGWLMKRPADRDHQQAAVHRFDRHLPPTRRPAAPAIRRRPRSSRSPRSISGGKRSADVTGGESPSTTGNHLHQPDQRQAPFRAGAVVDFPADRDRLHLQADVRQHAAAEEPAKIGDPQAGVRIVPGVRASRWVRSCQAVSSGWATAMPDWRRSQPAKGGARQRAPIRQERADPRQCRSGQTVQGRPAGRKVTSKRPRPTLPSGSRPASYRAPSGSSRSNGRRRRAERSNAAGRRPTDGPARTPPPIG